MLKNDDFKTIVETISTPILIVRPVLNDKDCIVDLEILFSNAAFSNKTNNPVKTHSSVSTCFLSMADNIPWIEMATQSLETNLAQEHTFYSPPLTSWLRIIINSTPDNLFVISISDVSADKEHEQQLKRQNLRLASLTDELSLSREDLRTKLNNIQILNEKLEFAAYHDTMTGLKNRTKLMIDIDSTIKESLASSMKFGILMLDIDNMKVINDSQGHKAGDELLIHAVTILKRFERSDIHLYRFGGDEFLVLATNIDSRNSMMTIGDAMLESFNSEGIEFSGGITVFPDDSTNRDELLKYVDMAMYDVKKLGKNNITFFQSVMQKKFLNKLNMQIKMINAIENDIFQLYFQPQFNIAGNELRGFEALLRWHDDELGWINPEQFIPLAEESRLVIPIGDWVLETAISTLKKWQSFYNFKGIMSVNVSPVQLKKQTFIFDLAELISKYGIVPSSLEIEITEGVLIENSNETIELLKEIRKIGVGISLDDFGTGYSSLSYLQILPITTLKIDKSFIANITSKNGIEANITDSIIAMVTKMGLKTIAEGVENQEQLSILQNSKCCTIQGFLKGKPMPEDRCAAVIAGDMSQLLTINTPDSI